MATVGVKGLTENTYLQVQRKGS